VQARSDDGSLKEDNPLTRFGKLMSEAAIASGRVPASEKLLRGRLEEASYAEVQSFTLKQPLGPWAKDKYDPLLGLHYLQNSSYSLPCLNI
jgi:hypothetical protein